MAFTDEKIQQLRREARQHQPPDFTRPILIGEEEFTFTRTKLFEDKISLLLPAELTDMPPELAKLKYPMEQRPQIIKTSPGLGANFAFNFFSQPLLQDQTAEATQAFKSLIKRMQPANRFFDGQVEKPNGRAIGWFDFKSPGIDEPLYTMMMFTSIEGMLFHGIFNTAARYMEDWKPVALEAFRSIQDETQKIE